MTTKRTLDNLFITAIKATVREDKARENDSLIHLQFEKYTFMDRIVANFLIIASAYYKKEVIEEWIATEFFDDNRPLDI